MRDLKSIIDDYLAKQTDYAVQIVGSWGYGKTFYYRNELEEFISNKPSYSDAEKKYKPIYISLFGLKSTEEIATKIVLDFYQSKLFKDYFKNTYKKKRLKITQSVLKIGLRGFLNFQKLGGVNDYLTDIKHIGENVLDTNELVICFDDLERKDSALNIEDLTGYINSLVDEGIKVLLISNEDLLLTSGAQYKNLKEKIIGISVEFIPNARKTVGNIISLRYSGFPTYINFLDENIDNIVKVSGLMNNNFRHLIYALDTLLYCYSIIKKDILDSRHEIIDKVVQEMPNILTLVLALAVEYKSSALKYSDLEQYSDQFLFMDHMMSDNQGSNVEVQNSPLELFLEKYEIQANQYRFYKTIFNYITSYEEFDLQEFIQEFKDKFHLNKGRILPHYEVLQALHYNNCFQLSDEEYRTRTLQTIAYAKDGLYAAHDYYTVMHYAERLDNILNLDIDKIRDELINGLKLAINKKQFNSDLSFTQFNMSGRQGGASVNNKQLHKAGMEEIKLLKENSEREKMKHIANLLLNNPQEFHDKFQSDPNIQSDLAFFPFLNYVSPDNLIEMIKKTDSNTILLFQHFFKERYEDKRKLKLEIANLKKFTELLCDYREMISHEAGNKLRHFVVKEFADNLMTIIEKPVRKNVEEFDEDFD